LIYEKIFSVHYLDIDENNVLKPHALLNYLQEIGCLHSDSVGLGLYDVPRIRFAWIVLGWKLKIYRLPSWNENVKIITWPRGNNDFFSFRDYEVYDSDNNLIACASSKWVCFNIDKKRIVKVDENVRTLLPDCDQNIFGENFGKLKEPESHESSFSYTILKHDVDTNHHLNNVNYLTLALDALPNNISNLNITDIEIMYKSSSHLGDNVVCFYHKENEKEHVVTIKSKDMSVLHGIVKFNIF